MLDRHYFDDQTVLINYLSKSWRVVESQENVATLNIVDTMEEQGVLEALIDEVKPRYRVGTENLHYLIKTAFRYPPLKYGSRFGTRAMPSYFYASEDISVAFAETAYYRFLFFTHISTPYNEAVDSKHTAFSVLLRSSSCLDLCAEIFSPLAERLTDKSSYEYCQAVGDWAVNQRGADLIRFTSARAVPHPERPANANLAVVEPMVINSKKPESQETWLCRTTKDRVSFSSRSAAEPLIFSIESFQVDGALPMLS